MEKKIIRIITIIMAAVMILSLLLSLFASGMHVHAASSSEIQDQIDQLKDEQAEVKEQIAQLEAQRKQNQADIKTLVAEKNIQRVPMTFINGEAAFPGGKADYLEKYRAGCITTGKPVQIITPASREEAQSLTIDEDFRLVVRTETGDVRRREEAVVALEGLDEGRL